MILFVDTSAFFALLDRDDGNHARAKKAWRDILGSDNTTLVTTNYILVESFALIQHRLGLEAVRGIQEDVLPLIGIEWVHEQVHRAGVSALLAASKHRLSLVDCVSFETMRSLGIKSVFAFDRHFSCDEFRESYPVIKWISLFCKNTDFSLLVRLPDFDRCSRTRYSIPDDEISLHSTFSSY